jgi:hypothetical protein
MKPPNRLQKVWTVIPKDWSSWRAAMPQLSFSSSRQSIRIGRRCSLSNRNRSESVRIFLSFIASGLLRKVSTVVHLHAWKTKLHLDLA